MLYSLYSLLDPLYSIASGGNSNITSGANARDLTGEDDQSHAPIIFSVFSAQNDSSMTEPTYCRVTNTVIVVPSGDRSTLLCFD